MTHKGKHRRFHHEDGACCRFRERRLEPRLLLLLLAEGPTHGYRLLELLDQQGFGDRDDPPGVYRTLRCMEEEGLVRSSWETPDRGAARRLYEITPDGRERLEGWMRTIKNEAGALLALLESYEKMRDG
ncbi:MAG: PadR family transcriptional regulator [candidate division WOR-3 bacterium]